MIPEKTIFKFTRVVVTTSITVFLLNSSFVKSDYYARADDDDSDLGQPTSRGSGQGRNPCSEWLIALTPGLGNLDSRQGCNVKLTAERGYTSVNTPTLWFHVPKTASLDAKFVLIDNGYEIQKYYCKLPPSSGIVGFRIPAKNLDRNNVYRWEFSILKGLDRSDPNPKAGGKIEFSTQASSFWYDEINTIAEERMKANATEFEQTWISKLDSVGLNNISSAPIVGYCEIEN
jgi:hypothetical protein